MRELYSLQRFDLPPELRLILSCLRLSPNDLEVQQIEKLSRTASEWHNFLRWVDHHQVAPLVYTNLRRYAGKAVPSSIMRGLRNRFERNAHRGLANALELVRLHKLFQENGISVFPLKGSVLALQVYGNLALRHAGDIDLLVNPRHVDLADRLLRERYCRISPGLHLTPYQQKQYYRLKEHLIYIHDGNNLRFELHTRLLYNRPYFALDLAQLQERARYLIVANASVPAMSPEDNFLYLCDHGARHYWQRLFWLSDLAEIIRQDWVTDWDLLLTISTTLGISRPLAQGVILAHLLFETPLPDQIRAYAARDQGMPYLIKAALRRILTPRQEDTIEMLYTQIIYLPKLYTDFNYKIECMKRTLFYSVDWGTFPVPDVIFPYFLILRPFMWFYRRLRRSQGQIK
ncbi:MAG: nucleotidyltransferase family protein [Desulfobaccales bacterium]